MRFFKKKPRELVVTVEFALEDGKPIIKVIDKDNGDLAEREVQLEGLVSILKWSAHSLQALGYKSVDEVLEACKHEP